MKKGVLRVVEMFKSIQGEGIFAGQSAMFIRLAGCHMNCAFCDSVGVWTQKGVELPFQELDARLKSRQPFSVLVLTGGSPMMQQLNLVEFLGNKINQDDYNIQIEDEGVIYPQFEFYKNEAVHFVVSPKLSNSRSPENKRIKPRTLKWHVENDPVYSTFKFVVSTLPDVYEATNLIKRFKIPTNRVWLMPKASTKAELEKITPQVVQWATDYGYNFSPRLQISIWDRTTGV